MTGNERRLADHLRHVVMSNHQAWHREHDDKNWLECPRGTCRSSLDLLVEVGYLVRRPEGFVDFAPREVPGG